MAVQIKTEQIKDAAINAGKIDLTATYAFTSGVLRAAEPSANSDVATKQYVDGLLAGLHWKASVRVATTANITLSGTQTIDGIGVTAGQRVLVKDQSSGAENGIYVCAAGAWSRSSDMDAGSEFPSAAVFVREGTVNADLGFVCTNDAVTLGSTAVAFTQFNGAANITAGAALSKSGNTLNVEVDDSSIEISGDALRVKASGITNAMLAGSIANSKLANATISGIALGANLADLTAGSDGGLVLSGAFNGATARQIAINLDGNTLTTSASGLKVADGQINTAQIADSAITNGKLAGSITANKLTLGTAFANASGSLTLANGVAGNGLALSAGQALSVDLDGGTLAVGGSGLKIADDGVAAAQIADNAVVTAAVADLAITNAKLAGSITAAKLAGSIPSDKLNLGQGVEDNGGNLQVKLDGSSLARSGTGIKVADNGVGASQVAAGAITGAKLSFAPKYVSLAGEDGSKTAFDLPEALDANLVTGSIVYLNGLALEKVSSSPGTDQYTVSATGGTGGVGQIVMGAAPEGSDDLTCLYFG